MFRVRLAPELRAMSLFSDAETVAARRFDELPGRNGAWPVRQDSARGVPHEALGHRTEKEALEPLLALGANDDQIRAYIAGELSDFAIGTPSPRMERYPDGGFRERLYQLP
jgi:hypothetical protein